MSAICGILYINGKHAEADELLTMSATLRHHGRDGSGFKLDQSCGMAQQTINLTQESCLETYPYVCDAVTLTGHVRLSNRADLCQKLSLKETPTLGDGALIVAAYRQWGLDCLSHLLGEFAVAIWDAKEQALLCFTDHFNTRPLYYYQSAQLLAWASEPRALHTLAAIPRAPNLSKIARNDFLRFQLEPGETEFAGIYFLPPASYLRVKHQTLRIRSYWQLEPSEPSYFPSLEAFREAFEEVFATAVRGVTRTHLPIGLQLSGGLDSSSIAMMAAHLYQNTPNALHCFSNVLPGNYQGTAVDEKSYIEQINAPSLIKHEVPNEHSGPFDFLDQCHDTLQVSPQHYQHRALNQKARDLGAGILLHGTLGEITASHHGREYLPHLATRGKWHTLAREVLAHNDLTGKKLTSILARDVLKPLLRHAISQQGTLTNHHRILQHSLIRPAFFQAQISEHDYKALEQAFLQTSQWQTLDPRQNAFLQMQWFLRHASRTFTQLDDSPHTAVYLSNPYFDKHLVDFCLAAPNSLRFHQGYPRSLLRLGMEKHLPPAICWRTSKSPFLPDYYDRYNKQREKAALLLEELRSQPLVRDVIDTDKLSSLLTQAASSSQLGEVHNFLSFLVIPRAIYLAIFLSSI